MGQSSSTNSKTVLPSANLLIDASDSYVTDVKLRSTGIIPISEYIKKDKYSKNLQRLKQSKKNSPEDKGNKTKDKDVKKGKLETIEENRKNDKATKPEDNKKNVQKEEKYPDKKLRDIEEIKKEKQKFIESSYEDIPDNRKWINEDLSPKYLHTHFKNRKTQTKRTKSHRKLYPDPKDSLTSSERKAIQAARSSSTDELMQIYKNDVYPHVYKNTYKRRMEQKLQEQKKAEEKLEEQRKAEEKLEEQRRTQEKIKEQRRIQAMIEEERRAKEKQEENKKKMKEPVSADSNMYIDYNRPHKNEESTHQLTQHHFKKFVQFFKKPKLKNLVVQTNVACVIHPNKRQRFSSTSSEDILKKPENSGTRKYLPTFLKKEESTKKHNTPEPIESSSNTSTVLQHKVDKIDKITEEHRRFLSGRQALTNWKNIHTLKQHRKLSQSSYEMYPEENQKNNNKTSFTDERYNVEYNPSRYTDTPMDYIVPPRRNRSRAGCRKKSRTEFKMSPLEISNYYYSKLPENIKMEYISPKEIKERNQRTKYQSNHYERPNTQRYEYIENTSYCRYPQQPKYQNYPKYSDYHDNYDVRPATPASSGRRYRNNPMPEISERDERIMAKEDFIADMERCLKKHQNMGSIYERPPSPNKATWVQDKYRRWHKVVME